MRLFKYFLLAGFSLAAAVWTTNGVAMSFFGKKQEVVIASPLSGVITYEGIPLANAKVERWLQWKDKEGETQVSYTNTKGEFFFSQVDDEVKISPLSAFVITQDIHVYQNAEKKTVWSIGKDNYNLYGEFGGEPIGFSCELTDEDDAVRTEGTLIWTSCKWQLKEE